MSQFPGFPLYNQTEFSCILLQCVYAAHDDLQDVTFLQRLVQSVNVDLQNSWKTQFFLLSATISHEHLFKKKNHEVPEQNNSYQCLELCSCKASISWERGRGHATSFVKKNVWKWSKSKKSLQILYSVVKHFNNTFISDN